MHKYLVTLVYRGVAVDSHGHRRYPVVRQVQSAQVSQMAQGHGRHRPQALAPHRQAEVRVGGRVVVGSCLARWRR